VDDAWDPMFTDLPQYPKPWRLVACSYALQVFALAALVAVGMMPQHVTIQNRTAPSYVPLVAPLPEKSYAQAQVPKIQVHPVRPVVTPKVQLQAPVVAEVRVPRPLQQRPPEPVAPPKAPVIQQKDELSLVQQKEFRPQAPKIVQTGTFSTGSSATPTTNLPSEKVQTGGFGDPNGAKPSANSHPGGVQMAQLGGFDLPPGAGVGNGTGGDKGSRGVVASAGFGNGVATATPGKGGTGRVTRSAGFATAEQVAAVPPPSKPAALKAPDTLGVEILDKPTPQYTEEARRLKIEGEVLLQVTFGADGKLQVIRTVRGLGHGLDEAAVRAAERIRFKPAMREGKPVDSNATLHIVFQLA